MADYFGDSFSSCGKSQLHSSFSTSQVSSPFGGQKSTTKFVFDGRWWGCVFMDADGMKLSSEILKEVKDNTKRWFWAFLIMVVLEIATIGVFMWYISLPIESEQVQIENEDGNANYIGHDLGGDLTNQGD